MERLCGYTLSYEESTHDNTTSWDIEQKLGFLILFLWAGTLRSCSSSSLSSQSATVSTLVYLAAGHVDCLDSATLGSGGAFNGGLVGGGGSGANLGSGSTLGVGGVSLGKREFFVRVKCALSVVSVEELLLGFGGAQQLAADTWQ